MGDRDIERSQSTNTVWHPSKITREDRETLNGHKSTILWFTGLSGAGKSTVAYATCECLYKLGCRTYVCDGDNIRHGLCSDLRFSPKDRTENIRRIGEVAKLFVDAGVIVLAAFISPYRSDRGNVRNLVGPGNFFEIYCQCPLEICEARDVKGLYKRARAGEIQEFTGITAPYEEPESPELVLETHLLTPEQCVNKVLDLLVAKGMLRSMGRR